MTGEKEINSSYWAKNFFNLEKKFQKVWLQAYKDALHQNTGLWYSTAIQRFARAFSSPQDDWFKGVLFKKPTSIDRGYYQEFLLRVAPQSEVEGGMGN